MTSPPSRRAILKRWLLALLLLAVLAWGLGEMREDRGAKPEMGVGDLRSEEPAAVPPREPAETAAARPRPAPANPRVGDPAGDEGDADAAEGARAAER